MAFWDNGFHQMCANRPLHHVADFKGLKMRIQSSKVLDAQMRALGAIPQVMAFSELYQALQSGVVDGTEGTPSNFLTQKTYEVTKDITLSNHGHLAYAAIVNKKFWDGLPADIRTTLDGCMKDATTYANAIAATENMQALEKIKRQRQVHHLHADAGRSAGVEEGADGRPQGDGSARRQGNDRRGVQGHRLRSGLSAR